MIVWENFEWKIPQFAKVEDRKKLGRTIKLVTTIIMGLALCEKKLLNLINILIKKNYINLQLSIP